MNHNVISTLAFIAVLATFLVMAYVGFQKESATASSYPGVPANVATTSQSTVGTTATVLFATSTCAARTITTAGSGITLTFTDKQGTVPTGALGVIQAASTTVTYDSGLFGCDTVKAYSYAAQLITIQEAR